MRKLLIDADMLLYRMCAACEERSPFNKEILIKADPEETWNNITYRTEECLETAMAFFDEKLEVVMVLSPKEKTFRYDVYPEYKHNRKDTIRPVLLGDMYEKLIENYDCRIYPRLEADDVLGILADGDNTIIVSDDKDLKQIESWHMKLSEVEYIRYIDETEGMEMFYEQCISGDTVDGYKGVPGMGKGKAKKWLQTHGYKWSSVVSAYTGAMSPKSHKGKKLESVNLGLTEKDALVTARLAWILKDKEEYNEEESKVKGWSPDNRTCWI